MTPLSLPELAAAAEAFRSSPMPTRITVSPLAMPAIRAKAEAANLPLTPACIELKTSPCLSEHLAHVDYSDGSTGVLDLRTGRVARMPKAAPLALELVRP
jgi:hypothetical protein